MGESDINPAGLSLFPTKYEEPFWNEDQVLEDESSFINFLGIPYRRKTNFSIFSSSAMDTATNPCVGGAKDFDLNKSSQAYPDASSSITNVHGSQNVDFEFSNELHEMFEKLVSLKGHYADLAVENKKLKEENLSLLARIESLEEKNSKLQENSNPSTERSSQPSSYDDENCKGVNDLLNPFSNSKSSPNGIVESDENSNLICSTKVSLSRNFDKNTLGKAETFQFNLADGSLILDAEIKVNENNSEMNQIKPMLEDNAKPKSEKYLLLDLNKEIPSGPEPYLNVDEEVELIDYEDYEDEDYGKDDKCMEGKLKCDAIESVEEKEKKSLEEREIERSEEKEKESLEENEKGISQDKVAFLKETSNLSGVKDMVNEQKSLEMDVGEKKENKMETNSLEKVLIEEIVFEKDVCENKFSNYKNEMVLSQETGCEQKPQVEKGFELEENEEGKKEENDHEKMKMMEKMKKNSEKVMKTKEREAEEMKEDSQSGKMKEESQVVKMKEESESWKTKVQIERGNMNVESERVKIKEESDKQKLSSVEKMDQKPVIQKVIVKGDNDDKTKSRNDSAMKKVKNVKLEVLVEDNKVEHNNAKVDELNDEKKIKQRRIKDIEIIILDDDEEERKENEEIVKWKERESNQQKSLKSRKEDVSGKLIAGKMEEYKEKNRSVERKEDEKNDLKVEENKIRKWDLGRKEEEKNEMKMEENKTRKWDVGRKEEEKNGWKEEENKTEKKDSKLHTEKRVQEKRNHWEEKRTEKRKHSEMEDRNVRFEKRTRDDYHDTNLNNPHHHFRQDDSSSMDMRKKLEQKKGSAVNSGNEKEHVMVASTKPCPGYKLFTFDVNSIDPTWSGRTMEEIVKCIIQCGRKLKIMKFNAKKKLKSCVVDLFKSPLWHFLYESKNFSEDMLNQLKKWVLAEKNYHLNELLRNQLSWVLYNYGRMKYTKDLEKMVALEDALKETCHSVFKQVENEKSEQTKDLRERLKTNEHGHDHLHDYESMKTNTNIEMGMRNMDYLHPSFHENAFAMQKHHDSLNWRKVLYIRDPYFPKYVEITLKKQRNVTSLEYEELPWPLEPNPEIEFFSMGTASMPDWSWKVYLHDTFDHKFFEIRVERARELLNATIKSYFEKDFDSWPPCYKINHSNVVQ